MKICSKQRKISEPNVHTHTHAFKHIHTHCKCGSDAQRNKKDNQVERIEGKQ